MRRKPFIKILFALLTAALLSQTAPQARAAGNIDSKNRFAWSSSAGWFNFSPANFGGVSVYSDHLEGFAWAENVGWISLGTKSDGSPGSYANTGITNYGVNLDTAGNLSGYGWSTNAGWINFSPTGGGVTIDLTTGAFDGYAWCESIGWIHFRNDAVPYKVSINLTKPSAVTSSAANKIYKQNDAIPIDVVFNRAVTVNGTPKLTLETGTDDALLDFSSGNGTTSLTFDYTVSAGHESSRLDYLSSTALALSSGETLLDAYGLNAVLTLPVPGQNGSLSVNKNIIVDGIPPLAPTVGGTTPTKESTPTWNWNPSADPSSSGDGTFRYSLDKAAFSSETKALSFTPAIPLSHGTHTLDIQERDLAGNWSPSGSWPIDVDLIPPGAPTISGTTPTNNPLPTWTWTTGGGGTGTFFYSLNSGLYSGTITDTFFTPPDALSDSTHTLSVQEQDNVGNWSTAATFQIKVDTTAPSAPTVSGTTPTNDTTPTWTWTSSEGNSIFQYQLNGGPLSSPTTNTTYTAGLLTDGSHVLSVQEQDAAGNWSAFSSHTIVVDTIAPTAVIANPPTSLTTTNSYELTVGGEGVKYYQYKLDSGVFSTEQSVEAKIKLLNLIDGTHTLRVIGKDAAGNQQPEPGDAVTWKIDTTGPVISGLENFSTPKKNALWTWSANESAKYRYVLSQESGAIPAGDYAELAETKISRSGGDGYWYLALQAIDTLGNESSVVYAYALLDNTPPVLEGLTNDDLVRQSKTWFWNANELATYRSTINLSPTLNSFPDIDYSSTNTASKEDADGTWYLHVQAKDIAGNESEINSVYAVFDNAAAIIKGLNDDPAPKRSVTWTWTSEETGVSYRYVIDRNAATIPASAPWFQPTTADNSFSVTIPGDQQYADGTWYLHVQAKDASGFVSETKTVYAVLDNTRPNITGLEDEKRTLRVKYWEWGANETGTLFRYLIDQNLEALFPADAAYDTVTEAQKDGSGDWYLHVQAIDPAGNESAATTVHVFLDPTAPIVPYVLGKTPTNNRRPTWTWRSGGGNQMFSFSTDGTNYSNSIFETEYTPPSDLLDGIHTLHVKEWDPTLPDGGGWSDPASFSIEVDTVPPPALTVSGGPEPLTNQRFLEMTFTGTDAVAYKYNIDSAIVYSEEFPIADSLKLNISDGPHLLYVIARDEAGNWQRSQTDITEIAWIVDTQAPAFSITSPGSTAVKSAAWTWAASGEEGVTFRYAIDTAETCEALTGKYGDVTSAAIDSGDGRYYIHVQAKDPAGNESAIRTVSALLDNTRPVVTGLSDGTAPAQWIQWEWAAQDADPNLSFRFTIDQNPSGQPLGDYTSQTTEIKSGVTGTWYIHVQARDGAGNESEIATASALLDNSPPVILGLFSDSFPVKPYTSAFIITSNLKVLI